MPIKAYVGLPRHGKTYEVVTEGIYNALVQGRRVVTNIAGVNHDAMLSKYIADGGNAEVFGQVVSVDHAQVLEENFWLTETNPQAFIQPGDFLALDEIWRFWSGFGLKDEQGNKRPSSVMIFFRMHGHFTHPVSGFCCEIAFITQSLDDFHRSARAVIEETYRMEKLTALGSKSRYRVDIYNRGRVAGKPIRQIQRSYNPDLFSFYSSHSQREEGSAEAVESSPDQRGNILKGALFKIILPVGAVVLIASVWTVVQFFKPKDAPKSPIESHTKSDPIPIEKGYQVDPMIAAKGNHQNANDESERWRVVGWISGTPFRLILTDGKRKRVIAPPSWKLDGMQAESFLPSGEAVTTWSGSTQSAVEKVIQ